MPFVDATAAERLFRHRVMALLRDEGLSSERRSELLLSWRNSGFSVHNGVAVAAGDMVGIQRLGCSPQPRCARGGYAAAPATSPVRPNGLSSAWAQLLCRVYEVEPLTCGGGPMHPLAFIQEPAAAHSLAALEAATPPRLRRLRVPIRGILAHLERQGGQPSRAPPEQIPAPTRAAS